MPFSDWKKGRRSFKGAGMFDQRPTPSPALGKGWDPIPNPKRYREDLDIERDQREHRLKEIQDQIDTKTDPINQAIRRSDKLRNALQGPVQTERPWRPANTGRYWKPDPEFVPPAPPPGMFKDPIYKFPPPSPPQ